MKNQNDLIVMIVAGVVGVGAFCALFFTKREPVVPAKPTAVPTDVAKGQEGAVTMSNSLPQGGGGSGFGSPAAGGGSRPAGPGKRPGAAGAGG